MQKLQTFFNVCNHLKEYNEYSIKSPQHLQSSLHSHPTAGKTGVTSREYQLWTQIYVLFVHNFNSLMQISTKQNFQTIDHDWTNNSHECPTLLPHSNFSQPYQYVNLTPK